jgi:hypothetical protein
MAITNAQQFKQLVNPPMKGKKRPGYRGDDAYGSGDQVAGGGDQGNVGGNRDAREIGARLSRTQAMARANQKAKAALGDPDPEVDVLTKNRLDTITNYGKNLKARFKSNPFSVGPFGVLQNIRQTQKAREMLGLSNEPDDFGPDKGGEGELIPVDTTFGGAVTSTPQAPAVSPSTGQNLNRIAYRLMADGGAVIDDEPRQAYGLGSIVKKATRAVKKVVKSDIGKAAIAAAGIYYLGGGGNPFTSAGRGSFSFGKLPGAGFFTGTGASVKAKAASLGLSPQDYMRGIGGKTRETSSLLGNIFGGKTGLATAGILAASTLPLLGVGVEEDEEEQVTSPYLTEGLDMAAIRANPRKFQGQAYRLMSGGGSGDLSKDPGYKGWVKIYEKNPDAAAMNEKHSEYLNFYERDKTKQAEGSKEPVAKKVMPLLDMDGKEKDYRETGGFVDIGRMEKADDVPARLSKNEFVFTADAVRNAGDGSVDKGAEVMYNMMKNLEAGGEVSEESQGLEGARRMFQTSQRLEEVL